ncbi:MAG: DUF1116 domain-containing protein [Gammaproteobacteria bacterium]
MLNSADELALQRLVAVIPEWSGIGAAGKLTDCGANVLLHAGPAFHNAAAITKPIFNSACVAAVYEGLARDFSEAGAKIKSGDVVLEPAQDHRVVTPLASVVSRSMPLQLVRDRHQSDHAVYSPLNGGGGPAMRLGLCNNAVLEHLRWLNGEFADALGEELPESIALTPIARDSLKEGDDCHGRTIAATRILAERLNRLYKLSPRAQEFLANGPSFFLNLWMAASKCMLAASAGIEGSSLIITAGANGARTGIQIAGLPEQWFVHEAAAPTGKLDDSTLPQSRALGAIGDSAIIDALGLGAMAMNYAPEQQKNLLQFMPAGGLALPQALLSAVHTGFGELNLKVGTLARTVVDNGRQPVVSLGMLDIEGELGRLGGGIYSPPLSIFSDAVSALQG